MRDDAGWLGALLAVTLIGWALQPAEPLRSAHVPVQDTTAFQNELPPAQLGFPLPEGSRPSGRITRQTGTRGSRTVGRFTCPLAPAAAITFFRAHLPGRLDVIARTTASGPEATLHQTTADRRSTVRILPDSPGSELFLVIRDD